MSTPDTGSAPSVPPRAPSGADAAAVQPVESVRRALRVLNCFSAEQPELGVTELARMLVMHKSTIHRLLVTLEVEGFVYRVGSGAYTLSWKAFRIGSAAAAWEAMRDAVLDGLRGVAERTGETAHLAVLSEQKVLYVEKVDGSWSLRMPSAVGKTLPLNCTALGKVLLAGLEPEAAERIVYATRWPRMTDHTITDPAALLEEVRKAAGQGYAIDHEEIEEGLLCVAAPVKDDRGVTCAALSIAGPASRLDRRLEESIEVVREACAGLSARLGAEARRLRKASGPVV